jgi:hypothetical protein
MPLPGSRQFLGNLFVVNDKKYPNNGQFTKQSQGNQLLLADRYKWPQAGYSNDQFLWGSLIRRHPDDDFSLNSHCVRCILHVTVIWI